MGKKKRKRPAKYRGSMTVTRYPWDSWFTERKSFLLTKGVDFFCMPHSMSVQIRNAATSRDLSASIRITGEDLHVTISPRLKVRPKRKTRTRRKGGK